MFNVPLHSRSAIEAHRTRWRVESAQCLRSSHLLTMHPKKHAFSGTPPKLVGALIRRHKPYTKGIARVYEWCESAIGYRREGDEAKGEGNEQTKEKKKDWRAIYIINHNH